MQLHCGASLRGSAAVKQRDNSVHLLAEHGQNLLRFCVERAEVAALLFACSRTASLAAVLLGRLGGTREHIGIERIAADDSVARSVRGFVL